MKTSPLRSFSSSILLAISVLIACLFTGSIMARGSAQDVQISKIIDIDIKTDVIRITGDAKIHTSLITDKTYENRFIYGKPAQTVVSVSYGGVFELMPYQEYIPEKAKPELVDIIKKRNEEHMNQWKTTVQKAKTLTKGSTVAIAFYGTEMIIRDYRISKISGTGFLSNQVLAFPKPDGKFAPFIRQALYLPEPWSK